MKKTKLILTLGVCLSSFFMYGCSFISNSGTSSSNATPNSSSQKKWESASFSDSDGILKLRKDLTCNNNQINAYVDSGTGGYERLNFNCGNLGMEPLASGIDIDITLNENVETAGIQWYGQQMGTYDQYWISLSRHRCINIHQTQSVYNEETKKYSKKEIGHKYVLAKDCNVKINNSNNLKMFLNNNGEVDIYVNNQFIYTIPKDKLMYEEGRFFIVYQLIPNQKYTKDVPAKVSFRLNRQQVAK